MVPSAGSKPIVWPISSFAKVGSLICSAEGMIDSRSVYLFDQEDIDRIYHIGLQDQEEFAFRHQMEEELTRLQLS